MHSFFVPNLNKSDKENYIYNSERLICDSNCGVNDHKYHDVDKLNFFRNCLASFATLINDAEDKKRNKNVSLCESLSFIDKGYDSDVSDNIECTELNAAGIALSSDESEVSVSIVNVKKNIGRKKSGSCTVSSKTNHDTMQCEGTLKKKTVKNIGVLTRSMTRNITESHMFSSDESSSECTPIASRTRL